MFGPIIASIICVKVFKLDIKWPFLLSELGIVPIRCANRINVYEKMSLWILKTIGFRLLLYLFRYY